MPPFQTAAVIGAGIAGLSCARDLQAAGVRVAIFEKSRGPGGRTATRRVGDLRFDHGAQALAPQALIGTPAAAVLVPWRPRTTGTRGQTMTQERGTVPVPTMSAAARALADGLELTVSTLVAPLTPAPDGRVRLRTADGPLLDVDRAVVTAPAPQAAALLAEVAPGLAAAAAGVRYAPCWAVMAAWDTPLGLDFDVIDRPGEDLAWAADQASRPGRDAGERWVLQASAAWSAAHVDDTPATVAATLLERFTALATSADRRTAAARGVPRTPSLLTAHRWLYSEPETPLPDGHLHAGPVAAAGDWCGGGRVAGAAASGRAAAAALLADRPPGGALGSPKP